MPRPPRSALAPISDVDLSAVGFHDPSGVLHLFERLIRVADSEEFRRALMAAAAFPGSDMTTFLALNQLALHGALRPTDLAGRLETGRANVTKVVAKLETAGLAVRVADPADERGVLVALTAAGREVGRRVVELEISSAAPIFVGWSAEDLETFRGLLTRYVEGAEQFQIAALLLTAPGS